MLQDAHTEQDFIVVHTGIQRGANAPQFKRTQGRAVAVVLSVAEYERLETLEDAYWRERAHTAECEGYAGTDARRGAAAEPAGCLSSTRPDKPRNS